MIRICGRETCETSVKKAKIYANGFVDSLDILFRLFLDNHRRVEKLIHLPNHFLKRRYLERDKKKEIIIKHTFIVP